MSSQTTPGAIDRRADRLGSRLLFNTTRIGLCAVTLFFVLQFAFRSYESGPLDAHLFFALFVLGYTAAVLLVREAVMRGASFSLVGGLLGGLALLFIAYLYFPMGPEDCYDWLQQAERLGTFDIP